MPPPVPSAAPPARLPGWAWGLVALGVLMALAGVGVLFVAFQETQGLQLAGEIPKRGVPLTRPDEQLSAGAPGELRYTNKSTGAVRSVWNEGREAALPKWLPVPEELTRVTGSARRGSGRREASFQFAGPLPAHDAVAHFSHVLASAGLRVRTSETRIADSMVVGEGAEREAFVRITPGEGRVRVSIMTTEPAE